MSALPGLHAQLTQAVLSRLSVGGAAGFGVGIPIHAAVHDLLYSSDHVGHLGLVPGLLAMERVTRLALGDSLPGREVESRAVWRACTYLSAQTERLLNLGTWSTSATGEIETLVDEVLSRIDVDRVRLDWEKSRKRAAERIVEIDDTIPLDDEHMRELDIERLRCQEAVAIDYIDFEGRLYDAITATFMGAASPFEWYGFVIGQTAWLAESARGLLGLAEHSQARIVACPFDCGGWVGLSADPDVANCDGCGKKWPISDGSASALFTAFRSAGWKPRRVA